MSGTTNYIGTKMYLTERGRELYGYSDVPLTSEWEVVEIDEGIVTLRNNEYGYTTKATDVSLFMLSEPQDFTFKKSEQPSVKQKSTADYIGKKVRATKAGEEYRRAQGLENFDDWEILGPDREGELKIKSPKNAYTLYTTWDALFGETPLFEIIEEPYIQLLSETDFKTMPPPVFASNANYTTMPRSELNNTQTVLEKAKDLIYGSRVNDYGKTSDNFANICAGWEIIFKDGFTPERVGLAMAWLKICRASNDNCEKEDSLVDLAGYAGCIEKIKKNL